MKAMSAFIKQYKARNGSTVIQVVFKNGRSVVKTIHVGTGHNDIEIAELRALAKDIIYFNNIIEHGDNEQKSSIIKSYINRILFNPDKE